MTRSTFFRFFLALACCLGLAACSDKPTSGAAQDEPLGEPLVIGMDLTYPPFETKDTKGKPFGVSIDMATALGEHLGRPIEIKPMAFNGLIAALKTGNIDLILSSMTANEKRSKSIDFSDPYLRTGLSILAGKDAGVNSAADLDQADRRIAVQIGTTGEMYARDQFKNAKLVSFDKTPACVLEVVNKRADAFIFDQLSVFKFSQKHADTTIGLLKPFQEEFWAFGIRKGNDKLRTEVNDFLAAFGAAGGFDKLAETHLAEEKAMLESMGIPFLFVTKEPSP